MGHWYASCCLGLLLTGRFVPVCVIVWGLPECRARAAFAAKMNRVFAEDRHCGRMADIHAIASLLRGPLNR